jgi:hypothetical protein
MPFTGALGTSNSKPGNIVLGLGGVLSDVFDESASNSLNLSQTATRTATFNRSVSQSLTFTQQAVKTLPQSESQTLTLSQTCTVEKYKRQGVVQALVLSHSVAVAKTYSRTVNQGLALQQSRSRNIYRVQPVASVLTLAQTAVGVSSKRTSSTLVLSQSAVAVLSRGARNRVELTQIVRENHTVSRRVFDVVPIFHRVALAATFRRTLTQSLTFTQMAVGIVVRAASHTLALAQVASVDKVKPGFSELVLTDSADVKWSLRKPFSSTLFLTHEVGLLVSKAVSGRNVLAMEQRAVGTRIITRTVSHTLALSQEMYRIRYPRTVSQTLVLSQTVAAPKRAPRTVGQSLTLSHAVSVAKTLNRSMEHSIVFQNSFTRVIALPGQPTVTVPTVQVVKVRSLVILESGSGVIVLPAPEFNDKEGGNGRINIKRAMDGTRRIYKRDQPSSRLMYDFIMDRVKAIELRQFILMYNSSVIRMTNWKGEIWYVVLTNNPFQLTEDAYWQSSWGNKCSITLEFQGVKVN